MTYVICSHIPLAPDTRKRPPQGGFVQTGFKDIKGNLPQEDFWPDNLRLARDPATIGNLHCHGNL
jgi:hypothetical protein